MGGASWNGPARRPVCPGPDRPDDTGRSRTSASRIYGERRTPRGLATPVDAQNRRVMGSTAVLGICGPPREIGAAGLLARSSGGGGGPGCYRRHDLVQVGQLCREPSAVNEEHCGDRSVEVEIIL